MQYVTKCWTRIRWHKTNYDELLYTNIYLIRYIFVENMAFIIELDFCLYLSITNLYGLGKLVSTSGTVFYTTECLL